MRKITIDITDTDSIARGLDFIKSFTKAEEQKIKYTYLAAIAKKAADAAIDAYPAFVQVIPEMDYENGIAHIKAVDAEICFIEFGAGVYAAPEYEFAGEAANRLGIRIYPGSWSETHWRTFQGWVANGRQGEYRYNVPQHAGLVAAYNAVLQSLEELAKEVFLK